MTSIPFAVVGPGRVGVALGELWSRAGHHLQGFVGRSAASVDAAVERCGGRALALADLGDADVVLLAPADDQLAAVVAAAAAAATPRPGSLWLHTSGSFDVEVLAPLRARGAAVGSLHPVCPVPDADAGIRDLPGKPAVLAGAPEVTPRLEVLARAAGMRPVVLDPGTDRVLYHAACALAANGVTALFDQVEALFAAGLTEAPEATRALPLVLMRAALDAIERRGPARALSGPVQRGDHELVARHLAVLAGDPAAATYAVLMAHAVVLARRSGDLTAADAAALDALLRPRGEG